MVVAHTINERRSVALKAVASELFGSEAADKQKGLKAWLNEENRRRQKEARLAKEPEYERANFSHVPDELIIPYGLDDVILTRQVCDVYDPRIAAAPDLAGVVEFERKAMDALYAIEKRGLPAHQEEYRKLEQEVVENLGKLEDRVMELALSADPIVYAKELAGPKNWGKGKHLIERDEDGTLHYEGGAASLDEFNPKSTPQVIAALKAREADMSYMSEKNGKLSADAENLRAVDDELAAAILDFRSEFKVLSTYVRPMIGRSYVSSMNVYKEAFIAPDDRIHANYRQVGARTGRMSCSDPNMQNQPRDDLRLRYNIVADPGHVFVTCDLSNIEMVIFAAYCGEGRLLKAVKAGEDLHVLTAKMLGLRDRKRPGGGIETARQLGKTYNFCRPLNVEILTMRGWLRHDEVRVDDLTLGYNPETRTNEWTRITDVHHFDDAPLVKMSSGSWAVTSTPEHRWVTEKMRRPELQGQKTTAELNSEDRIILSAPSVTDNFGCAARLDEVRRDGKWERRVLAMADNERRAWLSGIALGEGSVAPGGTDTWTIAQNKGDLYDAICLALYMEGFRPSRGIQHTKGAVMCQWVRASKPSVTGQRLVKKDAGRGPVWCVTTELGSWTARENGEIGLTGNSRIYGGGLRTIKRSFRCSMDEARLLKRRFDDAYPEVSRLQNRIEYKLQDDGYIQDRLISGRRFRVDPRDSYKATNYLVQGTAASLLKHAVINLHADGVPMIALVHDEVVAHVPVADAKEVALLCEQRMTEFEGLRDHVPLAAEADIVKRWSDAKQLKDENGDPYLFTPEWASGEKRPVPSVDEVLRAA
jgi:DNA polymerase I-like protein with 3'-5' exonuclease and polymerase domains